MDKRGEFNREEFRRIITQVRPEFYDREHYFLIVEIDGPKAKCKVVDRIVTTTTSPDSDPEPEPKFVFGPENPSEMDALPEEAPAPKSKKATNKTVGKEN